MHLKDITQHVFDLATDLLIDQIGYESDDTLRQHGEAIRLCRRYVTGGVLSATEKAQICQYMFDYEIDEVEE